MTKSNTKLKCSVVVLLFSMIYPLKLTPVQQVTQKIDLVAEAKTTTLSLRNAFRKVQEHGFHLISIQDLIESSEFQKLNAIISRWKVLEERLKLVLQTSDSYVSQVIKFKLILLSYVDCYTMFIRRLNCLTKFFMTLLRAKCY